MIDKAEIMHLVKEKLNDNMFLVDITVNDRNVINIYVDSFDGLTIDQCVSISRHVEHSLDRDVEDFELQVSSPGLTESFKVIEQYYKYAGKEVEIVPNEGEKLKGFLLEANEEGITLETSSKEKLQGQKKKKVILKKHQYKYEDIKSTKAIISFK